MRDFGDGMCQTTSVHAFNFIMHISLQTITGDAIFDSVIWDLDQI